VYFDIEFLSYIFCAAGFLILTVLVSLGKGDGGRRKYLLAASTSTTVWAGTVALAPWIGASGIAFSLLELVRTLAWIGFAYSLMDTPENIHARNTRKIAFYGICSVCIVASLTGIFAEHFGFRPELVMASHTALGASRILLTVIGLLLVENILRNANAEQRWALKYLCFGMGAVFAYDFLLYADSILFLRINNVLFDARGFVNALVAPLMAVSVSRSKTWDVDIHVSRQMVFHSAALVGSGLYLLGIAGAGYYLKQFGGDWGQILQVVFLFGAAVALLVLLGSAAARARAKIWISKNFFSYKYDYREEWLRFIRTVAAEERHSSLHERIIQSIAAIVDCSAGALWVLNREDNAYLPTAGWNMGDRLPAEPRDSSFISFLDESRWIIDLGEFDSDREHYKGAHFPKWLTENPRAWLVAPFVHKGDLTAFLVLGSPKVRREMAWEDYDLLKIVGNQAASYLAEQQAMNELSDARRLESFNQRFAFVVHDIKNLVSQMSLMLQNAEKHGDNPDFQKDMLATVGNSIGRMKQLLTQFQAEQPGQTFAHHKKLGDILSSVAANWKKQKADIQFSFQSPPIDVLFDSERLESVLNHLLQNAIEAAGINGKVSFRHLMDEGVNILEIEDNGPGMDAAYIQDQLFRPLDTVKPDGYGLGAYQTRELVRQLGGRLDVESKVGQGTIMRVILPITNLQETPLTTNHATPIRIIPGA
jgi:putative PEP-CTERM system histidine kinase